MALSKFLTNFEAGEAMIRVVSTEFKANIVAD